MCVKCRQTTFGKKNPTVNLVFHFTQKRRKYFKQKINETCLKSKSHETVCRQMNFKHTTVSFKKRQIKQINMRFKLRKGIISTRDITGCLLPDY